MGSLSVINIFYLAFSLITFLLIMYILCCYNVVLCLSGHGV